MGTPGQTDPVQRVVAHPLEAGELDIWRRPAELLQTLIRFDTRNPPGSERACLQYLQSLLAAAGCETTFKSRDDERPNLIARLRGRGTAPPLLLHGHVDVVPFEGQDWRQPPLEGCLVDGEVWGRGALDMKGGVAMLVSAVLRARAETLEPAGDVIVALVCDEETGSDLGARFLVEEHPELFADVRYAIGETGGFTQHMAGRRFYPIQVAEKQICTLRATLRGPGGHGSVPKSGTAVAKLGRVLRALERKRLPVHVTPLARLMIEGIADGLPRPLGVAVRSVLEPRLAAPILRLLREEGLEAGAFLRNTVTPTVGGFGGSVNTIPSEVTLTLDGRILPGLGATAFQREVQSILPTGVELDVVRYDPEPLRAASPDLALLPLLAGILREADPGAIPFPMLLPGVTDARWFSRLGIQTYGFLPMNLPKKITPHLMHAADERVPAAAIEFGTSALYQVLRRYGSAVSA